MKSPRRDHEIVASGRFRTSNDWVVLNAWHGGVALDLKNRTALALSPGAAEILTAAETTEGRARLRKELLGGDEKQRDRLTRAARKLASLGALTPSRAYEPPTIITRALNESLAESQVVRRVIARLSMDDGDG